MITMVVDQKFGPFRQGTTVSHHEAVGIRHCHGDLPIGQANRRSNSRPP
jgi:hypothetical protein